MTRETMTEMLEPHEPASCGSLTSQTLTG